MFKLNEEIEIKAIIITRGFEFSECKRLIMLDPFYYVSLEEDEWDAEDYLFVDIFGCNITDNFQNQEEIIKKFQEESKNNIKNHKMIYSIKKLKKMINGEKIKTAGNHHIEYLEGIVKYFWNKKYNEIDIEYIKQKARQIDW